MRDIAEVFYTLRVDPFVGVNREYPWGFSQIEGQFQELAFCQTACHIQGVAAWLDTISAPNEIGRAVGRAGVNDHNLFHQTYDWVETVGDAVDFILDKVA